jgi:hypothetical protein
VSHARKLAKLYVHQKSDTDNTIAALRFQAMAWRIVAMIGTHDKEAAKKHAQWLLFQTVPFVNGPAVEQFIAENQDRAEAAGKASGVFAQ